MVRRTHRKESANTIVLITVSIVVILIGIGLFALNYTRLLGGSSEHHTAIEAASLTAAQELSKIVINDENYGYIGLSDFAPIGKGTLAGDQAPMPVMSINTIIGTARLDTIVAGELADPIMQDLAKQDVDHSRDAAQHLNQVLEASLKAGSTEEAKDYDGNQVLPFDAALKVYKGNSVVMASGGNSDNFRLALGYITEGTSTQTQIPQPEDLAQVPQDKQRNGKYKGFINIPANGEDFYFAGVGESTSLVSGTFVANDNSKPASAVRAEADQHIVETTKDGKKSEHIVHSMAMAIPAARTDDGPGGSISISFPNGLVPGINKVSDFLSNEQLKNSRAESLTPSGEDHPTLNAAGNPIEQLGPAEFLGGNPTVAQSWIGGFYHWMRNNKIKPRIDDLKKMQQFAFDANDPPKQDQGMDTALLPNMIQIAYAQDAQDEVVLTGLLATGPDTDKKRYEALLQNSPGAVRGFAGVASAVNSEKILPPNCLLVGVTKDGKLVSPNSNTPISLETVYGFWTRLMETNTASLACIGMSNKVLEEIKVAEEALPKQISELRRQVDLLNQQLLNPMDATTLAATQQQIQQLNEQANALTAELGSLPAAKEKATRAKENGEAVARKTDCIARNQRVLSSKGLTKEGSDYVIGGVKFTPHPLPPATLQAIKEGTAYSGDAANTSWTADQFYCFAVPATISSRGNIDQPFGLRAAYAKADPKSILPPTAKMYLFRVQPDGHIVATTIQANPYKDVKVSEKQIYSVCYSAITTSATSTPLVWTSAMRDQTAVLGTKKGGQHGGQPMAPDDIGWCLDPDYGPPAQTPKFKKNSPNGNAWGWNRNQGLLGVVGNLLDPYGESNKGKDKVKLDENGRDMRASYICGGIATDFQIRSPMVKINVDTAMNFPRKTDLLAKFAEGMPLTVTVAGQQFPIPATSGLTISPVSGAVGPGYTITPGTSTPTPLCPPPPPDFS